MGGLCLGGTHQALEPVSQLFANVESLSLSIHASICPPLLWGRGLVLAAGLRNVVWGDSGMEKAVGGWRVFGRLGLTGAE